MSREILNVLDIFFISFHTIFSIFNMTGWIWRKTRPLHLVTITLTGLSWFFLGIWYGWGYCFCTDWHWQVREALGNPVTSWSYIHFLIKELTGIDTNPALVDAVTLAVFFAALGLSFFLSLRDRPKKKPLRNNGPSR